QPWKLIYEPSASPGPIADFPTISTQRPATAGSAGINLITQEDCVFDFPHVVHILPLQLTGPLPTGSVGLILPRSSASKKGLFVVPGVMDTDYEGIIKIQIYSNIPQTINKGDSWAQLIILPVPMPGQPSTVRRGDGGFGRGKNSPLTASHTP
uniref:dUTPase-like domain-containing protein n=1 Tax=Naja naja TaxID=35670 RepID=A0A8C6VGA7_NAJNA